MFQQAVPMPSITGQGRAALVQPVHTAGTPTVPLMGPRASAGSSVSNGTRKLSRH